MTAVPTLHGRPFAMLFCLYALLAAQTSAGEPHEVLYVANSLGDDVTVIEIPGLRATGTIKVGNQPHGLAASRAGDRLYVSVESSKTIEAIDTTTNEVLWSAPVSDRPNQIALSGDDRFLYVPIRPKDYVEIVDTEKRAVVAKVKVGGSPHNALASADGKHIYVTSMDDRQVTIIDAASQKVLGTIPCGGIVRPIDVTRDERRLYMALTDLHGFAVVDIAGRRVFETVHLPNPPEGAEPLVPHTPTHGLGLSPDNRLLVVTSVVGDYVALFSLPEHVPLERVATGKAPNWITFRHDGKVCYVSNAGSDNVSVIDLDRRKEVARLTVGRQPKRLLTVMVPHRQTPTNHDEKR